MNAETYNALMNEFTYNLYSCIIKQDHKQNLVIFFDLVKKNSVNKINAYMFN